MSNTRPSPQMDTEFLPHVTVATVVEHEGKFLFVEELSGGCKVINQPAGHLEANETLQEAALRETLEETGCIVTLDGVLGVNLYTSPNNGVTYHRTTFTATLVEHTDRALDEGILRSLWLRPEEARLFSSPPRSPLVLDAIERFCQGKIHSLELLQQP